MRDYKRWFTDVLKQSLKVRKVAVISGARQCGKTTLAKHMVSEKVIYKTLDDVTLLKAAQDDPQSFIKTTADTFIIDEIQKAPDLLPSIKLVVDQNNRPGQFLLTGSADIRKLPQV
ncbi:MAG: AAA family ATPase [Alphaproteobacteria bacterium]|nr:AAA family ATPase [Alphaproteobacteria bacterium]